MGELFNPYTIPFATFIFSIAMSSLTLWLTLKNKREKAASTAVDAVSMRMDDLERRLKQCEEKCEEWKERWQVEYDEKIRLMERLIRER